MGPILPPPPDSAHPGEPHQRDDPVARGALVVGEPGALGHDALPELVALGPGELLGDRGVALGADLDLDLRVGLEVEVPGRVLRRAAVRRDDHGALVVLGEVDQRRDALGAGPRADVVDEDHGYALEHAADAAGVGAELRDDLLVPVAHFSLTTAAGSRPRRPRPPPRATRTAPPTFPGAPT